MAARGQQCTICMDSFKNPKLISCHHSFCCKCLEDYVRVKLHNGCFDCPLCRTSVEVPNGGVSAFKTNFYIETDFVWIFTCDLCGPKSMACRRCLECNENLCLSCCHAHEKSKVSRYHKIIDLGTLDPERKGQIRQRIFCDKHPEKELELFCIQCRVLICYLCKAVSHDHHATDTISDAAADVKKTLQSKMDSCSDKLRRITEFQQTGQALATQINDAERKEMKALDKQRLQLIKLIDQEVSKKKDKIQSVYEDRRQQAAAFIRDMEDDFKKYSNTHADAKKLIEQESDIDIVKNGPGHEQLLSTAISKDHHAPNIPLDIDLFSPAKIKPRKITSLIGIMKDSTKTSIEKTEIPKEERKEKEKEERQTKEDEEIENNELEERQRKEKEERERNERIERDKKEREERERKERVERDKREREERERKERVERDKREREERQIKVALSWSSCYEEPELRKKCSNCQGWLPNVFFLPGCYCKCRVNK